jgi:hypothetical protein
VNRYKSACKETGDLRFGLVSYPTDVRDSATMIAMGQRRLQAAKAGKEPGAVVFRD